LQWHGRRSCQSRRGPGGCHPASLLPRVPLLLHLLCSSHDSPWACLIINALARTSECKKKKK
jgi:hypothetical protein